MGCFDFVCFEACVLLIACLCEVQSLLKSELVIGGYVVGSDTAAQFLETWRPIFEDFLNEQVGGKQFPQIRFRLIAVDFSEETGVQGFIDSGLIDLVCEHIPNIFHHRN